MPIVKSIITTEPEIQGKISDEIISNFNISGVPIDVFSHFSVPLSMNNDREIDKLKEIYVWARQETNNGTLGDILQKIRHLETELGSPSGIDKRYDKLYRYCTISLKMKELDKRREALRRIF